jgi:integrase
MLTMVLMYLNMLRASEILQLKFSNVRFYEDADHFDLTLTWRKTMQNGEKQKVCRFYPRKEPEFLHLCPWKAIIRYMEVLPMRRLSLGSMLIRKVNVEEDKFEMDLPDHTYLNSIIVKAFEKIGVDTSCIGTHSFRRGGCQFFNLHCNWPLKMIAMWGGWSMKAGEEMNMSVICRYLQDYHDENSAFQDPLHPNNIIRYRIIVQSNC